MNKISDPNLFKTIKSFLTVYLPKIKEKSPHTIQSYKDTLNIFIRYLKITKDIPLYKLNTSDFNPENIIDFLSWLQSDRKNSDSTRNQRLKCLRVFCRYLAGENILEFETYTRIQDIDRKPLPERVLKDVLSIDEVKHLLELPNAHTPKGLRDRFYIALLYDTGCRNQELLDLNYGDIRLNKESGCVNIIGKGKKFRVTPLSKEVIDLFKQYAGEFHSNKDSQKTLFFTSEKNGVTQMSPDNTARILTKYEKMAKTKYPQIVHLHPHLFRHTRAMHLYQAGMPLPLVSEWLGHSQLETTTIYAYADSEMKRLAAEKLRNSKNSVFTDEIFKYRNDESAIKKLYGLS